MRFTYRSLTTFLVVLVCLCLFGLGSARRSGGGQPPRPGTGHVKAWNVDARTSPCIGQARKSPVGKFPFREFPEEKYLKHKSNVGISTSGGGTRAYMLSIGYFRALMDLGLYDKIKYDTAVSGGSWASSAFTYYQESVVGLNDTDFLGEILPPEKLTLHQLGQMNWKSARASPVQKGVIAVVIKKLLDGVDLDDIYGAAIDEIFLRPAGVSEGSQIAWNKDHLNDILRRNPNVFDETGVILPCEGRRNCNRPYPIVISTMLGPTNVAPFDTFDNALYAELDGTPIYVGVSNNCLNNYTLDNGESLEFRYGGLVETFGFGGSQNDADDDIAATGLGPNASFGILKNVQLPPKPYGLRNMTTGSSFAPGSFLSSVPLLEFLNDLGGMTTEYSSVVTEKVKDRLQSQTVFLADGAAIDNTGVLTLLQRRVQEQIIFLFTEFPLPSRESFDPFAPDIDSVPIDSTMAALFGFSNLPTTAFLTRYNQVFPREELLKIIGDIQDAAVAGNGSVVRSSLTTIANDYWGIPAGIDVNITWVYLSRALNFEKQLPEETRVLVQPQDTPDDPSTTIDSGPFSTFPHLSTLVLRYTNEQANLYANYAGWIIKANRELFEEAILGSRRGSGKDRHGSGRDRHGSGRDRHGSGRDRHGSGRDRHGSGRDRHGSGRDRHGSGRDRHWSGRDRHWSGRRR